MIGWRATSTSTITTPARRSGGRRTRRRRRWPTRSRRLGELQKVLFAEGTAVGSRRAAGDGRRRQGRRAARRADRDQPGRRRGDLVRRADRGRARPRLPLARAPPHAGQRPDRRVQPQPLRGRAGGAREGARPAAVWRKRYDHIRNFEQLLVDEGTAIVKIYLNMSHRGAAASGCRIASTARRALEVPPRRPRRPHAVAGVHAGVPRRPRPDLDPRRPWYVVPADRKWVRNLAVAKILRHTLDPARTRPTRRPEAGRGGVLESADSAARRDSGAVAL